MGKDSEIKKEKTKRIKRKRDLRLLFQVGAIFAIIFTLLIVVSALIQTRGSTQTYLEAKQEFMKPLAEKMRDYFEYVDNLDWFLDFWARHPESGSVSIDPDTEYYAEMVKDFPVVDLSMDVSLPKYDPDQLENYTRRQQMLLSIFVYDTITTNQIISTYQMENETAAIIDVSDEHWGHCIFNTKDYSEAIHGDMDPEQVKNYLGADESELLNALSGIRKVKTSKTTVFERYDSPKDGNYYYLCITPIFNDEGDVRAVLILSNDWSEFHSTLMTKLFTTVAITALAIAAGSVLLLFFINRAAIRPLAKVQKGVREYMVTKDSVPIVEQMDRIKQRNEFGVLADDVSHMVVEMDRHTSEIAKLTGERERVATELSLASSIQMGVLPVNYPNEKDYELYATMTPAKEVGGDLYDFFDIDETHLGLVIGDVSGKGVPASLFMMIAKLLIQEYSKTEPSPASVLTRANKTLCENNKNDMFVTAWFGIMDRTTGKITASSAGHEFPILRDPEGEFRLIKDRHGFVLGGMDMSKYREYELELKPGGTLLVYTDGAAEATNANDELFGTDRMLEALNQHPEDHPREVIAHLTDAINEFVGTAPQFDDLTMLCVRYNGREE